MKNMRRSTRRKLAQEPHIIAAEAAMAEAEDGGIKRREDGQVNG